MYLLFSLSHLSPLTTHLSHLDLTCHLLAPPPQVGYYLYTDVISGMQSCRPCSLTWYQGREGTKCDKAGITLETLPVLPGFFRQSLTAQLVRKCINIDAGAACLGSMNVTSVVQQKLTLDMAIEQYDEATVKAELATLYGVSPDLVELTAEAGSVGLTVTIRTAAAGTSLDSTAAVASEEATRINAVTSDALALSLGVAVSNVSGAQAVPEQAAGCGEGYGGPYCAVCAKGWYGGGEGKTCAACADAGDPTLTISIQGGVAFAVLLLVTLLMLKFGKKAAVAASEAADKGNMPDAEIIAKDIGAAESGLNDMSQQVKNSHSKAGRAVACLKRIGGFISSLCVRCGLNLSPDLVLTCFPCFASFFLTPYLTFGSKPIPHRSGVKMKILVSLYQVLGGLGMSFNIPYPDNYTEWLESIKVVELNMPALLPLDCLLGGISFMHTLVIQVSTRPP